MTLSTQYASCMDHVNGDGDIKKRNHIEYADQGETREPTVQQSPREKSIPVWNSYEPQTRSSGEACAVSEVPDVLLDGGSVLLQHAVVKIVREKYLKTTSFESQEELQTFISELYVFLVDQMHVALNQVGVQELRTFLSLQGIRVSSEQFLSSLFLFFLNSTPFIEASALCQALKHKDE